MENKSSSADKPRRKSWTEGLQAEYHKITWPDRSTLGKQSGAVIVVSIILGIIISIVDILAKYGIQFVVK